MAGGVRPDLGAYLERMTSEPFIDGATDCILSVADWIALHGYPDPATPFRGRYSTPLGRARIVRREGGLQAIMSDGAERSGLSETTTPIPGDVGLVRLCDLEIAAICLGKRWAAKGAGLVVGEPEEILKAWRV